MGWIEERAKYFGERGMEVRMMKRRREKAEMEFAELVRKDDEMNSKERWDKIREFKYNR